MVVDRTVTTVTKIKKIKEAKKTKRQKGKKTKIQKGKKTKKECLLSPKSVIESHSQGNFYICFSFLDLF